jgi:GntR family transcriptional regulator / MocR family aminotransferase
LHRAGSAFYVGTFSKSLLPALRIGFVVAPAWSRPALIAAKQIGDWHSMVLAQDTLTAFIQEGHLARHVRKMRKVYGQRREILLRALSHHCGDRLQAIPAVAGLHLAARLSTSIRANPLVKKAAEAGIAIDSLDRYAAAGPARNGLAFGYGAIPAERIDEAIRRLARAMG